jgi:restriction system protein
MAEVTTSRTGELLRKLFEILFAHPEGVQAGRALELLSERVQLSDYEKGQYASGGRRFEKIVRFARRETAGGTRSER